MTRPVPPDDQRLFDQVIGIIEQARQHATRTVNTVMIQTYWSIGARIVEVEQAGKTRAGYGDALIRNLAGRLSEHFPRGFGVANLRLMRQFYLTYPNGSTVSGVKGYEKRYTVCSVFGYSHPSDASTKSSIVAPRGPGFPHNLSWSHYRLLMRVQCADARAFYEIEAVAGNWSVRELERQIASLTFERLASHGNPSRARQLADLGQTVQSPSDLLKDPLVLEFLDLGERPAWTEHDLEAAIITRLQDFMLELGKGFGFVGRQQRISIDGDHFYIDLVFYNRLLRAFVLVDLKLGKLAHQDLGQMQMYVHYFDRFERARWESPTVGIVLCSAKNDAMVRITLPEDNAQIHTPTYQTYLPTEDELRQKLLDERARWERGGRGSRQETKMDRKMTLRRRRWQALNSTWQAECSANPQLTLAQRTRNPLGGRFRVQVRALLSPIRWILG